MNMLTRLFVCLLPLSCCPIIDAQSIYGTTTAETNTWRAISSAPASSPNAGGGLDFPIPFSGDIDRVYWDLDGAWDLSGCTGFELDVSCAEPQAMRSLSVYFRSGQGWYIWNQPLSYAGRQKLNLPKSQFSVEGSPSGWNAIDKVRLSPWKGQARDTVLTLHRLAAHRDSIYIVSATESAPNSAERSLSQRTADRLSRWLKAGGIAHTLTTEDQLSRISKTASVIVLPYNPKVPDDSIASLHSFKKRGGKLLVFYSSDSRLADMFGIKLGSVTNTRDIAQWRGMQFDKQAPSGFPARIHQQSWSIGPAVPTGESATVIARWMNASGQVSDAAAVIAAPAGYWFTHILLDDDMLAKQRLMSVALATLDESHWSILAEHALLNAGRVDGWRNTAEVVAALEAQAVANSNSNTIRGFTKRIRKLDGDMYVAYQKEQYRDVVLTGYELTDLMIRAYGLAQRDEPGEFRGVWDHDGTGWYPGDWERTAALLADSGINQVFVNATWTGLAHYRSEFLPDSFTYRFYGDQLAKCIDAAHRRGLKVHAWIICWNIENAPAEFVQPLRGSDRLQWNTRGEEKLWLNPAHPDNRRHLLNVIGEIVTNYNVDGIHLDYIRYPASDFCYSPYTRKAFETNSGLSVSTWPDDVLSGGIHRDAFIQWRSGLVTDFVREVRDLVDHTKPDIQLSAAVWGGYPQVITSIGQDWGAWMEQDLLDFVCPMNYAQDLYRFTALIDQQLPMPGVRGKVYPGIGVTANESQLRGDQVIEQILALRKRGVGGFLLYDLSQTLVDDVLPALRLGVTKP